MDSTSKISPSAKVTFSFYRRKSSPGKLHHKKLKSPENNVFNVNVITHVTHVYNVTKVRSVDRNTYSTFFPQQEQSQGDPDEKVSPDYHVDLAFKPSKSGCPESPDKNLDTNVEDLVQLVNDCSIGSNGQDLPPISLDSDNPNDARANDFGPQKQGSDNGKHDDGGGGGGRGSGSSGNSRENGGGDNRDNRNDKKKESFEPSSDENSEESEDEDDESAQEESGLSIKAADLSGAGITLRESADVDDNKRDRSCASGTNRSLLGANNKVMENTFSVAAADQGTIEGGPNSVSKEECFHLEPNQQFSADSAPSVSSQGGPDQAAAEVCEVHYLSTTNKIDYLQHDMQRLLQCLEQRILLSTEFENGRLRARGISPPSLLSITSTRLCHQIPRSLPSLERAGSIPASERNCRLPDPERIRILSAPERNTTLPVSEHTNTRPEHNTSLSVSEYLSGLPASERAKSLPDSERRSALPMFAINCPRTNRVSRVEDLYDFLSQPVISEILDSALEVEHNQQSTADNAPSVSNTGGPDQDAAREVLVIAFFPQVLQETDAITGRICQDVQNDMQLLPRHEDQRFILSSEFENGRLPARRISAASLLNIALATLVRFYQLFRNLPASEFNRILPASGRRRSLPASEGPRNVTASDRNLSLSASDRKRSLPASERPRFLPASDRPRSQAISQRNFSLQASERNRSLTAERPRHSVQFTADNASSVSSAWGPGQDAAREFLEIQFVNRSLELSNIGVVTAFLPHVLQETDAITGRIYQDVHHEMQLLTRHEEQIFLHSTEFENGRLPARRISAAPLVSTALATLVVRLYQLFRNLPASEFNRILQASGRRRSLPASECHRNVAASDRKKSLPASERPRFLPASERPRFPPASERPRLLPTSEGPRLLPNLPTSEGPRLLPTSEGPRFLPASARSRFLPASERPRLLTTSERPRFLPASERPWSQEISERNCNLQASERVRSLTAERPRNSLPIRDGLLLLENLGVQGEEANPSGAQGNDEGIENRFPLPVLPPPGPRLRRNITFWAVCDEDEEELNDNQILHDDDDDVEDFSLNPEIRLRHRLVLIEDDETNWQNEGDFDDDSEAMGFSLERRPQLQQRSGDLILRADGDLQDSETTPTIQQDLGNCHDHSVGQEAGENAEGAVGGEADSLLLLSAAGGGPNVDRCVRCKASVPKERVHQCGRAYCFDCIRQLSAPPSVPPQSGCPHCG